MKPLFIIGTGGFAKEVAQLATEINAAEPRWSSIAYVAKDEHELGRRMPFGVVATTDSQLSSLQEPADVAIGIGLPSVRRAIARRLQQLTHLAAPNLVHPTAGFSADHVRIGQGNIVTRGAVFTCDISVGDFNVFNLNCTVGHDASIGSFNVVNPGCNISGSCTIGDGCLFGTGCQLLEGLQVHDDTTVGGGAVLVKATPQPGMTFVGVPARPLDR